MIFKGYFIKKKPRGNYKYHYRYEPFGNNAYSQDLVDLIIARIKADPSYLTNTRVWYRGYLSKKKAKKKS
jgi:hypothetical protein